MQPFIDVIESQLNRKLALLHITEEHAQMGADCSEVLDKLNADVAALADKLEYWCALAAGAGE